VQIIVGVATDPKKYVEYFKAKIKETAPIEFRTRYADYFPNG